MSIIVLIAYMLNLIIASAHAATPTQQGVDMPNSWSLSQIPKFYYDLSVSLEARDSIEQSLHKLQQLKVPAAFIEGATEDWSIGEVLFMRIQELLTGASDKMFPHKKLGILIKAGPNTLFSYGGERQFLELEINVEGLKNTRVGCVMPEFLYKDSYYKVGSDVNPPAITLGHELIHAIHALENHDLYKDGLLRFDSQVWPTNQQQRDLRPGIEEVSIWHKTEELLTVLGRPQKGPQLSEFWLRIAAGRLPRYAYQTAGSEDFYESTARISDIMSTLLGANWFALLTSFFQQREVKFDESNASRSLVPKKQLRNHELDQELSEANRFETLTPTQLRGYQKRLEMMANRRKKPTQ